MAILETKPQSGNGGYISFTEQVLNHTVDMKELTGLMQNEVSGPSNTQPTTSVPGKRYYISNKLQSCKYNIPKIHSM